MKFVSTRGQTPALSFSDAVATGLAPDGGLYLPETLPQFSAADLARFEPLPYAELCFEFLKHFATDIEPTTLRELIARSYTTISHPDIAPIVRLDERTSVLELFHGPTLAFKDFALQLLGNLYGHQCAPRRSKSAKWPAPARTTFTPSPSTARLTTPKPRSKKSLPTKISACATGSRR